MGWKHAMTSLLCLVDLVLACVGVDWRIGSFDVEISFASLSAASKPNDTSIQSLTLVPFLPFYTHSFNKSISQNGQDTLQAIRQEGTQEGDDDQALQEACRIVVDVHLPRPQAGPS